MQIHRNMVLDYYKAFSFITQMTISKSEKVVVSRMCKGFKYLAVIMVSSSH